MTKLTDFPWMMLSLTAVLVAISQRPALAQTLRGLNETLDRIEPSVAQGISNPGSASDAIERLDQAEADFARIAEQGRVAEDELLGTYHRLEPMLDQLYRTYQN